MFEFIRIADFLLGEAPFIGLDPTLLQQTFKQFSQQLLTKKQHVQQLRTELFNAIKEILEGNSTIAPDPKDQRFQDPLWQASGFHHKLMQAYLVGSKHLYDLISLLNESLLKERMRFITTFIVEALAPCNTLLGNPVVLQAAIRSQGQSLMMGFKQLQADMQSGRRIPQLADKAKFKVGKNIALSKGAVVFRNKVLELIQYRPLTAKVYQRPILLIPPQINKFYLLDINPEKSLIRYLAEQGIQTFVISWFNPTPNESHWNFDTYLNACVEASQVVRAITKTRSVNVLGACIGGYTAALLGSHDPNNISSTTYLVSALNTATENILNLFATDKAIAEALERSKTKGILEGHTLEQMFAWLRPRELVWQAVINNYLLGKRPAEVDLLAWNADTTNLSAAFHADIFKYLKNNNLNKKYQAEIDSFVMAGLTDHITPWQNCYENRQIFGQKMEFLVSQGGHIQSIVNPPGKGSLFYTHLDLSLSATEWLKQAKENKGSWWPYWLRWLQKRSGKEVRAPKILGNKEYSCLGEAPGSYVYL